MYLFFSSGRRGRGRARRRWSWREPRARRSWPWMRCRFIAGRISGRASRRRRSGRRFRMGDWTWLTSARAFDVAHYLRHAADFLREQRAADRRVIIVGGTGLYFRALTRGLCEAPQAPEDLAGGIGGAFAGQNCGRGWGRWTRRCCGRLDAANPRRLVRAIEVMEATGRSLARVAGGDAGAAGAGVHGGVDSARRRRSLQSGSRRGWRRCLRRAGWRRCGGLMERHGVEAVQAFAGIGYREIAGEIASAVRWRTGPQDCPGRGHA